METYTGDDLVNALRKLTETAQSRFWIATPYIGTWDAVRCIIGRHWWDTLPLSAVRLLTDVEEGNINPTSLTVFRSKGNVKTLRGLHAKLYIIDNSVILTSANLTRTAFACRHEIGIHLTGTTAQQVITTYETWWEKASSPSEKQLDKIREQRSKHAGEDTAPSLPTYTPLPPDPGDIVINNLFADYEPFRQHYKHLARQYERIGRAWSNAIPLYMEVDAFLDYLFHHNGSPSNPYKEKPPRNLMPQEQERQIRKHAKTFRTWTQPAGVQERMQSAEALQELLSPNRLVALTAAEVKTALGTLNCMHDQRIMNRVIQHNTTATIKNAWKELLHGTSPIPERMTICANMLYGFKRSGVQELLGWYDPKKFPIRNTNTNAGMRYLGYDVSAD